MHGGRHMHKEDRKNLRVVNIQRMDESGGFRDERIPGVVRHELSSPQRSQLMARVIEEKSAKFASYDQSLSHSSLIIYDAFRAKVRYQEGYSMEDFSSYELRKAVGDSPFREIYLISSCESGEEIYRPLRQILVMEAAHAFAELINDRPELHASIDPADFIPLLVEVMSGTELEFELHQSGDGLGIRRDTGPYAWNTETVSSLLAWGIVPSFLVRPILSRPLSIQLISSRH